MRYLKILNISIAEYVIKEIKNNPLKMTINKLIINNFLFLYIFLLKIITIKANDKKSIINISPMFRNIWKNMYPKEYWDWAADTVEFTEPKLDSETINRDCNILFIKYRNDMKFNAQLNVAIIEIMEI